MGKERALFAHSLEGFPQKDWQTLKDHSNNVADLAASFAKSFGAQEWARLLGLVHDAGKASNAFQDYILGKPGRVDHATAGVQLLTKEYGLFGLPLAYCVAGHHGGLPNGKESREEDKRTPLCERQAKKVESYDAFCSVVDLPRSIDIQSAVPAILKPNGQGDPSEISRRFAYSYAFLTKMLFSCLVDADYLDTERFMNPSRFSKRQVRKSDIDELAQMLDRYISNLEKPERGKGPSEVNSARKTMRKICEEAARLQNGLFTLSMPTGAGKTLSSLSFALRHAIANGQKRIIIAIPFTSIVEQTAAVLRNIFGAENILEHHSNFDFSEGENGEVGSEGVEALRLATENWDYPIIVTTNVQLFESLYSAKTSRSRKCHNIAESVIVLDEAQTLPDGLLKPCLAALEELCENYKCTAVLCSATQPALEGIWPFGSAPIDIVPLDSRFPEVFSSRVLYFNDGKIDFEDLLSRLSSCKQVLCVVDTRKSASTLYDALVTRHSGEGLYHLSANMVPEHRSAVLRLIKKDLALGNPCVVVSTQLVEAGVDVDFPVVYREVAGIDSIVQAAGRCNREGCLEHGEVHVFECEEIDYLKSGWLMNMRSIGKEVIKKHENPFDEKGVRAFFRARFQVDELDIAKIFKEMSNLARVCDTNLSFERYGRDFKFIDDDAFSVFVPWGEEGMSLYNELMEDGCSGDLLRRLQRYSVGVSKRAFELLCQSGALIEDGAITVLEPRDGCLLRYSESKGLIAEEGDVLLMC